MRKRSIFICGCNVYHRDGSSDVCICHSATKWNTWRVSFQFLWVLGDELTRFFVLLRTFAVRWTIRANLDTMMDQESI